ncbi:MAG: YIP1 family protein [Defluviitaleaceae bacterium]|nr:YIP1 family protein [Defluviitaleaceae bacterium]
MSPTKTKPSGNPIKAAISRTNFDFDNYFKTLKFSLYTMRRPLDGFWDLIHERRGSLAAAHTIVALAVIVEIFRMVLTNFQFIQVNMETFSAWMVLGQVLLPLLLWSVANWSLTTLFEGKGKISDIYMGTAYAMTPMIIINAALIPVSHVITFEEGALYWVFTGFGVVWFVLLILCAMKEIHDYSFGKAIITSLASILAIGIMIFIFIMFFAVVSGGLAYFYSIGQEVAFRFLG